MKEIPYAFISYSTKNQMEADAMRKLLEEEGIRTWMAPGNIPAGSKYAQVINKAVRECACFVLMLSDEAQNSIWVSKETERAVNYRKPIFPVQLGDIILNDEFELYISTDQVVAVRKIDRETSEIKKLIDGIVVYTGRKEQEPEWSHGTEDDFDDPNWIFLSQDTPIECSQICIEGQCFDAALIGEGFGGQVYKIHDNRQNADYVAKKYPLSEAFHIPLFARNDLGRDLESMDHPNLCPVINIAKGTEPIVVMAYIDGDTLEYHKRTVRPDTKNALLLIKGILSGLSYLHKKNIYYGDLTPENIMIDRSGAVKLCDFSESNYNGAKYDDYTIPMLKYRSPERQFGGIVDFRSDIYEAGMLLDDLTVMDVTDENADEAIEKGASVFMEEKSDDAELNNKIRRITRRATKKNPDERYSSAEEMLEDIEKMIQFVLGVI